MDEPVSCERMNSINDFRALLSQRREPPPASRFANDRSRGETKIAAPRTRMAATANSPGPKTPSTPPTAERTPAPVNRALRRLSETGDLSSSLRRSEVAAMARRRRRMTDGGCVSVMQTVVEKCGLKHLSPNDEKAEPMTVWPSARQTQRAHQRRHTIDGSVSQSLSRLSGQQRMEDTSCQMPALRRQTFSGSHPPRQSFSVASKPVPEHRTLDFGEDCATEDKMSRQTSISFLESSVLLLTSNLAEASRREAQLQESITELQAALQSSPASSAGQTHEELLLQNKELRLKNEQLAANLSRKTRVIESASASLPMVSDRASLLEDMGPLCTALNDDQVGAVLELLSLGMSSEDIHLLLLGQSETAADIFPYAWLAGKLQMAFKSADDKADAIGDISDHSVKSMACLTRTHMVQLLKEGNVQDLSSIGVPHAILAEVSLALMSGVDPWSIVNLLDGRVSRNSTLDITLAPELMGVLRGLDASKFGCGSPAAKALARLARRCSLSPMKSLRKYNQELENKNIALGAQLEDLQARMAQKMCHWNVEKAAPAISADLLRVDSFGSTGLPSPAASLH